VGGGRGEGRGRGRGGRDGTRKRRKRRELVRFAVELIRDDLAGIKSR